MNEPKLNELLEAAKALLSEMMPEKEYDPVLGQYMIKPEWENVTRLEDAIKAIDSTFRGSDPPNNSL